MSHRNKKILIAILLLTALLRFWNLGSGDTLSDEILYSFRAIGMLDFDESTDQTTPLEWFDPFIPGWTKISFHDHPLLVFAVQHIFMRVFGETTFAFRLPSALLGIVSVYLLYLIGNILYGERTGLVAAGLLGITVNHVAISRLGLQEAYVIFFILLANYFFLQAGEKKTYYIATGVALGLGLLTKYTTGILIPIFLMYIILYRRDDFFSRFLWTGIILTLLLFSPVLYYNYKLYQAVGHFDFQLSFLAGQNPKEWGVQPGKEEFPTLATRVYALFPNLLKFNSWGFLMAAGISLLYIVIPGLTRNQTTTERPWIPYQVRDDIKKHAFFVITLFWLTVFIIGVIGPSLRFLSMLTPFLTLGIAAFFQSVILAQAGIQNIRNTSWIPHQVRDDRIPMLIISIFFIFELGYSVNSQLLPYPKGPELWAWSSVRYENYNWGYQKLDKWIREQTDGRMPALAFEPKYHFVKAIHKEALANAERVGKKPSSALFVYDKNINSIAQLWTLDRLQLYHAWPIITVDTYITFLSQKGNDYFKNSGFTEIYYIFPTENVPWKKQKYITDFGAKLEQVLTISGLKPYATMENKRGDPVFRIYRKEM